ncbi:hypothetical protein NECAME_11986 [Necator americanus]|uniref:Uncharacterized protein n=1 Tax=Necator americanus TaxID=51031 RepID=W2T1W7_NECAM|nr:hypothetical protein NECAME_11986 [Necator americanus]ETN75990.1 hypothetical protein NECAME_11986 [Necator americanus]
MTKLGVHGEGPEEKEKEKSETGETVKVDPKYDYDTGSRTFTVSPSSVRVLLQVFTVLQPTKLGTKLLSK